MQEGMIRKFRIRFAADDRGRSGAQVARSCADALQDYLQVQDADGKADDVSVPQRSQCITIQEIISDCAQPKLSRNFTFNLHFDELLI